MSENILSQIKNLENLSIKELKDKYHKVFGNGKGIQNNKPYLIKRIAYKIQENALGGLTQDAKAEINRFADEINPLQQFKAKVKNDLAETNKKHRKLPLSGSIIRKTYKGNQLEIKVLEKGFEYNGKIYKSISSAAKEISGSHCSGFVFFNL
jgi:hypothetical protein